MKRIPFRFPKGLQAWVLSILCEWRSIRTCSHPCLVRLVSERYQIHHSKGLLSREGEMREMPKGLPARVLVMTSEEANPLTKRIPFSTVNLADYLPISVRLCCPVVSLHPSTSLLVSNPSRTTSSGGSLSQAIQPIPVNDQPILLSSSSFNFAFQSDILKSSTSGIASYIRLSTSVRQSLFLLSKEAFFAWAK